jgi:aspartate racemase
MIGVLGGMGPLATMRFLEILFSSLSGRNDREYPRMLVDFHTKLPSRTAFAVMGGDSPVPGILDALTSLRQQGTDVLCMPCNSADSLLLASARTLPEKYVSIIESTVQRCAEKFKNGELAGPVLVLGGRATLVVDRYSALLTRSGISALYPSEINQWAVEQMIEGIKRTGFTVMKREVQNLVNQQLDQVGARVAILACTELDIPADSDSPQRHSWISSSTCLADAVLSANSANSSEKTL